MNWFGDLKTSFVQGVAYGSRQATEAGQAVQQAAAPVNDAIRQNAKRPAGVKKKVKDVAALFVRKAGATQQTQQTQRTRLDDLRNRLQKEKTAQGGTSDIAAACRDNPQMQRLLADALRIWKTENARRRDAAQRLYETELARGEMQRQACAQGGKLDPAAHQAATTRHERQCRVATDAAARGPAQRHAGDSEMLEMISAARIACHAKSPTTTDPMRNQEARVYKPDPMLQTARRFGGLRFPELSEPPPGPLARLARELQVSAPASSRSAATRKLLSELPRHLSLAVMQNQHGPLLDRIARAWHDGRELRRLFDELMFAGTRASNGLSFEAIVELTELKDYAMRVVHRERASVWDEALGLL